MHGAEQARRSPYSFFVPITSVALLVLVGPLLFSLLASATNWSLLTPGLAFLGFENYREILLDPEYHSIVITTVRYAVSSVVIAVLLSLMLALLLNGNYYGRTFFRSVFIVPMVITPAVVGLFWVLLYDEQNGIYNYVLKLLGFHPIAWLSVRHALTSVIIMDVWQSIRSIPSSCWRACNLCKRMCSKPPTSTAPMPYKCSGTFSFRI